MLRTQEPLKKHWPGPSGCGKSPDISHIQNKNSPASAVPRQNHSKGHVMSITSSRPDAMLVTCRKEKLRRLWKHSLHQLRKGRRICLKSRESTREKRGTREDVEGDNPHAPAPDKDPESNCFFKARLVVSLCTF